MPDHVHLLVEGLTDDADVRAFVAAAKQKSGFDFSVRDGRRLWQKGYYERVLRDEEESPDDRARGTAKAALYVASEFQIPHSKL